MFLWELSYLCDITGNDLIPRSLPIIITVIPPLVGWLSYHVTLSYLVLTLWLNPILMACYSLSSLGKNKHQTILTASYSRKKSVISGDLVVLLWVKQIDKLNEIEASESQWFLETRNGSHFKVFPVMALVVILSDGPQ